MTTPLSRLLSQQIHAHGPMTVADYMAQCLMHPQHGYYQQQRVFGRDGDFITAPEVSQMFGEIVGLWLIDQWQQLGCPARCHLIEFGPGRGTLMADILKTANLMPAFKAAVQVHFVETSQQLRALQKEKVATATWHDDITSLPDDAPLLIVGNEFFDALPIHQFIFQNRVWHERLVGIDPDDDTKLCWHIGPASAAVSLISPSLSPSEGDMAEACPAALSIMHSLANQLGAITGAALFFDYGYLKPAFGDSFQALKAHAYVDPLAEPGLADLTAHVNFHALAESAYKVGISDISLAEQGQWLMAMGLGQRAQQLASGKSATQQQDILVALKRLTAPDEMGQLFKTLTFTSKA